MNRCFKYLTPLTTLFLIGPISAVILAVTQEGVGDTARVVVAAPVAALRQPLTVHFIRPVLTVVLPVTHLLRVDASISMSTLELS